MALIGSARAALRPRGGCPQDSISHLYKHVKSARRSAALCPLCVLALSF
nr:MAG TPA: hypothetical protein [Caudoviricetes sp.]